jgi:hypothetical protein
LPRALREFDSQTLSQVLQIPLENNGTMRALVELLLGQGKRIFDTTP